MGAGAGRAGRWAHGWARRVRAGCSGGRRRTLGAGRAEALGVQALGAQAGRRRAGQAAGAGARGLGTGRAACAHRLGQLGARAPGLVFNPVFFRLGIFPESLNEHCSL